MDHDAGHPSGDQSEDPVLVRRRQISRWSAQAKRWGYLCILVAMAVFVIGFVTEFSSVITTTVLVSLTISAVLLIPALIFGYGAKAAEREEAGQPFRY